MTKEQILINISRFINEVIIVGGHGYEFKQACNMILSGYDYDDVYKWYDDIITR